MAVNHISTYEKVVGDYIEKIKVSIAGQADQHKETESVMEFARAQIEVLNVIQKALPTLKDNVENMR